MAHVSAAFEQASFRGRNDDGSETTATWKAATNEDWTQPVDENFRVRFLVRETAGGSDNNHQSQLQYNLNSTGWNNVDGASSVVRSSASGNFADDANTTQQLGSGSFISPNDGMDEDNGLAGENNSIDFSGNDEVEVEYCVRILGADVSDADTIELRVIGAAVGVYGAYTSVPSVTASVAPEAEVRTATVSLDSALQEQLDVAASLEAAIQQRLVQAATLDGVLANLRTATLALDGALRFGQTAEASLNAAVREAMAVATNLQGIVVEGRLTGTALDAVTEAGRSLAAALDAVLRRALVVSASLDGFVQTALADEAVSLSLDAALQVVGSRETSLIAAVLVARQATASLESAVQQDRTVMLNLSAGVAHARTVTQSLDALLARGQVLSIALGAAVRARHIAALGIDAALGIPVCPKAGYRIPGRPMHEVAGRKRHGAPGRESCGIGSDGRVYVIPPAPFASRTPTMRPSI